MLQAIATKEGNDIIFPSLNEYGIPELLLTHQSPCVDLPFTPFRKMATSRIKGTLHFYVDDYRFASALWGKPWMFNEHFGKITSMCEPNYSHSLDTPKAVIIHQTFQKRWLGRYWQQYGFKIIVDLCIVPEWLNIATLGVPNGWSAFSTRIYGDRPNWAHEQFKKACDIAGHNQPLFLCYGGGRTSRAIALENGWMWIADDSDRARGRINGR